MDDASESKSIGVVTGVNFNGAGPNSGETILILKPENSSASAFVIEMDTPPPKYFRLLETALTAMWDIKVVELTSTPWTNLPKIVDIVIL